ncbi:HECT-like ubiquitin-conjugating enzyme-binding-domain-containing protein [Amylocystis lapponica]|nr:HECT-like ubiquitin-conjugating enzyme-binding-domain-containing protein [Amylocystis lapponica]
MPPTSPTSPIAPALTVLPSHALQTLVLNLRANDPTGKVLEERTDDTSLIQELQTRVDSLVANRTLASHDAALARTLAALITHFHHLSALYAVERPSIAARASWASSAPAYTHNAISSTLASTSSDPFARLRRHLSDFQLSRDSRSGSASPLAQTVSPVMKVETALLWARVDEELEAVLKLCCARSATPADSESLPPEYDAEGYEGGFEEGLPRYEAAYSSHLTDAKMPPSPGAAVSEKMRMDLESVALAIDRLYVVAPQLHNQRVELKKSKLEQMERARLAGSSATGMREGKQRAQEGEEDVRELDSMVDLIGRASERKMTSQAFVIEGGFTKQLEKARQRDHQKRTEFITQLARHSDAGRLHSQDAVFHPHISTGNTFRLHDPEAMLSLPEFIREAVPEPLQLKMQMADPQAMLSLPDFVKEPMPQRSSPPLPAVAPTRSRSLKGVRSRSLSAPPLAWLLASSSRPSSPIAALEAKRLKVAKMRKGGSSSGSSPILQSHAFLPAGLDVHYVAEYHESLQHVLVFLTASGMPAGSNLEAEVVSISERDDVDRQGLLLKSGGVVSSHLSLPARVELGKTGVKVDGHHFQIKLAADSTTPHPASHTALLDAAQLSAHSPTSFICASCSLPLVQCARLRDYKDLPSEHWAELVDAWMCHSDQKLHEHVTKHTTEGFWPSDGHALVGGSYILLEESLVVKNNLSPVDFQEPKHADDWSRVRCLCGAVVGRSKAPASQASPVAYRLAKYAIRPMGPTADLPKVPLSAFIAEDMNELVYAHASYRFVVLDEEEERPRILLWLFKPSMRLAYATPMRYIIPKAGAIHAAKVLYKILPPTTVYSDLQTITSKYPGFPQAEHLYYPIDVCRRLGGLLKESNTAYPLSMRTMTGLDVGWLQRA